MFTACKYRSARSRVSRLAMAVFLAAAVTLLAGACAPAPEEEELDSADLTAIARSHFYQRQYQDAVDAYDRALDVWDDAIDYDLERETVAAEREHARAGVLLAEIGQAFAERTDPDQPISAASAAEIQARLAEIEDYVAGHPVLRQRHLDLDQFIVTSRAQAELGAEVVTREMVAAAAERLREPELLTADLLDGAEGKDLYVWALEAAAWRDRMLRLPRRLATGDSLTYYEEDALQYVLERIGEYYADYDGLRPADHREWVRLDDRLFTDHGLGPGYFDGEWLMNAHRFERARVVDDRLEIAVEFKRPYDGYYGADPGIYWIVYDLHRENGWFRLGRAGQR